VASIAELSPPGQVHPVAASTPAISLRDVSKSFPVRRGWWQTFRHPLSREWTPVVSSVTCDVRTGELFGLLGPNGAGKSTLFRMMSSTIIPDSGTILVGGRDIRRGGAAARRLLTSVPAEERSLNWRLSARENLQLYATLYGLRGRELRDEVEALLGVVELQDVGTKMVGTFSSGMKQRLMIARALLGSPRILLLDEPTRSLDPISARRLRTFLREELIQRRGCTVMLATHNHEEALELCDRVGVLARGRLLAVGTAASISAELHGERYQVWTADPGHPAWDQLLRDGILLALERPAVADWAPVEITTTGGHQALAAIVDRLIAAGVPVSQVIPEQLRLADLIEQVVRAGEERNHHA
jgi:ABC-2 type transport system ATP-binding protein